MKKLLCIILAIVMLLAVGCTGQGEAELGEEAQWELLSEAYRYTFPLVLMDQTMKAATNVVEPDLSGHAPINQLIHAQKLADSDSKLVVTPNVDTVYTQAWLDLAAEPLVFVMPETERYFQTQVLDAWTNTPAILESGSYLIAKTGWSGEVPAGLEKIEIPTDMVWLITRILINDAADITNVRDIQNGMKLLPLSAYNAGGTYIPPQGEVREEYNVVPVTAMLNMKPQDYFAAVSELMLKNPPPEEDAEILDRIAALNIGAGQKFKVLKLKGDIAENWKGMLQSLRPTLVEAGAQYQGAMGDWTYYGSPIGNFGTAYDYRAMIALGGLGANPMEVAIYLKNGTDSSGAALNGSNSYTLHFNSFPPTQKNGFWSVTAYGGDDFLIENELDRYCINDRTDFITNADGSLDIVLSAVPPENKANWLPVCEGDFHLFLRIYLPDNTALPTWSAPVISLDATDK